jgi:glycosyltransferase involved in cell wall biosynthesis
MKRPTVSAYIVCFNEEDRIRECLESVRWADEIIVVDSFSTDKTADICREYTDKIFQNPWPGCAGQKNFALDKATGDFVINIDADERVTPELRAELMRLLDNSELLKDGYFIPRKTIYLGRWIKHCGWYPNYRLRFYRRDKGRHIGEDPHDEVEVEGATVTLSQPITHYTYRDYKDQLRTIDKFSDASAREMFKQKKKFSWLNVTLRPWWRFFSTYILRGGFLDGLPGFVISCASAFYVFSKHVKLRELEMREKEKT